MVRFTRHLRNPFGGLSQLLEKLNLPAFDAAGIVEARRKDIEAVIEANRIVYNGAQALAQKQMEILRATMSAARKAASDGTFSGTPMEVAARQREMMTKAFQMALGHMRELADIVRKAQAGAFAVVRAQVAEDIGDLVGRVQRKGKAAAPAAAAAAKPARKPKAKAAPKATAKPAPKARAKPAPKARAKPAPKAKAKPGPKPKAKPAPDAPGKPVPRPRAKPGPKPKAK